jgi:hypothetical protein
MSKSFVLSIGERGHGVIYSVICSNGAASS